MKCRNNDKLAIARVSAWWLSNIAALAKAFHYGRAAQRDRPPAEGAFILDVSALFASFPLHDWPPVCAPRGSNPKRRRAVAPHTHPFTFR